MAGFDCDLNSIRSERERERREGGRRRRGGTRRKRTEAVMKGEGEHRGRGGGAFRKLALGFVGLVLKLQHNHD